MDSQITAKNGRHGRLDMIPRRRLGGELAFVAGEVRDWIRRHEFVDVPAPSTVDCGYGAQAGGRR